jgi:hypothetical protein
MSSFVTSASNSSSSLHRLNLFNIKLDVTTETELNAIAKPATSGGSRTFMNGYNKPAAMGIPSALYPNEKNKFISMRRNVARDKSRA